jgi:FKBP-type peptidyl-prolyl cis-trans isomerase 2
MLHVTSIALGHLHLAVVNGKQLAEGDSLLVATPAGVATMRVTSIEDGVVHFDYNGQLIDAKLGAPLSQKNAP